jgi:threonine dehydratase
VGGGGLIGGLAVALKESRPGIRLIGVEPEQAACLTASLAAGRPVDVPVRPTIADGLAVRRIGERTLDLAWRYLDDLVTVSEDEIAGAILKLLEIEKTVVEGAGAAALAAVLFRKIAGLEGKNVVMILSGGNIDPILLSKIIQRGLARDGRLVRIRAAVRDRPGELARVTGHVAAAGANTLAVDHNRTFSGVEVGGVEIHLTLETRGPGHIEDLLGALKSQGIECSALE